MIQNAVDVTYSIQQVSNITGLSKQVIRKWEERYGIVNPNRLDNGYRIYSSKEVNTILYVKSLVENGHTVKQAALLCQNRSSQESTVFSVNYDVVETQPIELNDHVISLLQEGENLHESNMNRILQQAYSAYGLRKLLHSIVIPFLKEVGARWKDGRWGEYQEAVASLVVRDFLVQLRRNIHLTENAPLMLGACLPGERHEIPVHIILLEGMLRGWKTVVLGPSPAPSAIQSSIEQLNPKKVILSALTKLPFDINENILHDLDEFAGKQPHIEFFIGGPGTEEFLNGKMLKHLKFTNEIKQVF
ncbi:MerR family transcriptional regulator [Bacillus sp. FJAT-29937]|uniref:MerR family transcriptional regulator n=1 Tax=Bacillus sp. FJAT-29937 TaxID=1720553 RepID=UPI000836EC4A|nr:MerR family transcriptional regulator [Bacillus sp. FJAT-29937]